MRVTKAHVEAKIGILNKILGFENVKWNTVGTVRLYGYHGGYQIHVVSNVHGGVNTIMHGGSLREASEFVSGMIAGIRIERGDRP